jgi:hypothetical protein
MGCPTLPNFIFYSYFSSGVGIFAQRMMSWVLTGKVGEVSDACIECILAIKDLSTGFTAVRHNLRAANRRSIMILFCVLYRHTLFSMMLQTGMNLWQAYDFVLLLAMMYP